MMKRIIKRHRMNMIQMEENTVASVERKSCFISLLSSFERVSVITNCGGVSATGCLCLQKGFDKIKRVDK